jgi:hypothetical protein
MTKNNSMSKTIYHSQLVKQSPVQVTFTSDVLDSKFKKQGTPSKFVCFKIGNDEFSHSVENDACVQALTGLKGQTVTLVATGSREDARIEIHQAGGAVPVPAVTQTASPRPPAQTQYTAKPAVQTIHGATVGAAGNQSISTMNALGIDWFTEEGQKELWQRISVLVRIYQAVEAGHLAPKPAKIEADDVPM